MKLYGVRYGKDFKYVGPDFPFLYYLVEIEGHFFMFDTTFSSQELAEAMGVNLFLIDRELKEVFGQIPNIDSIIITHSHWDHINDIWKYPDAKIYISRVGYELAMKDGDSQVKERLIAGKSQLILIEDEACIEERFHYWLIGGHSMDSAVVWFEEGGNTYCITGDECFSIANLQQNQGSSNCVDEMKNKEFTQRAYEQGWIPLPAHDKEIMRMYARKTENIIQIF